VRKISGAKTLSAAADLPMARPRGTASAVPITIDATTRQSESSACGTNSGTRVTNRGSASAGLGNAGESSRRARNSQPAPAEASQAHTPLVC